MNAGGAGNGSKRLAAISGPNVSSPIDCVLHILERSVYSLKGCASSVHFGNASDTDRHAGRHSRE